MPSIWKSWSPRDIMQWLAIVAAFGWFVTATQWLGRGSLVMALVSLVALAATVLWVRDLRLDRQ